MSSTRKEEDCLALSKRTHQVVERETHDGPQMGIFLKLPSVTVSQRALLHKLIPLSQCKPPTKKNPKDKIDTTFNEPLDAQEMALIVNIHFQHEPRDHMQTSAAVHEDHFR